MNESTAMAVLGALALAIAAPTAAASNDGKAIDPKLKITVEPVALVAGGEKHGIYSAQQVELDLGFDWGKIAGVKGLSSHVTFVNRSGQNASLNLLGDNLFQSQAIYGGTSHALVHLVQAYFEGKTEDGKIDAAAGRLPAGEAFATSPLYCEFMDTAVCGYPFALGAKQGFSVFPNSTWGARLKVKPGKTVYVQAGAYQVRPTEGGKWGFNWGWSGTKGAYLPIEAGFEPKLGSDDLPGHYKIGVGFDTSHYADNFDDVNGNSFVLSGLSRRQDRGRHTVYLLADQMVARNGKGERDGIVLFGGIVRSRADNSQISGSEFVGVLDEGIIKSRPHDSLGAVFSMAKISDSAVATQRLQQALGKSLLYGAHGVQSHEDLIELRYNAEINDHLQVMPDLQYVIRPGATNAQRNGLLAGVRLSAEF